MTSRFEHLVAVTGPVSRETYESLETYETEFRKWNNRINLAASSTVEEFWNRHVIDSAQVLALGGDARMWLDLGSGGGLPGAVVAILLKDREGSHIDLIESNRKKTAFLINVLGKANAPAKVHSMRIEQAVTHVKHPDIITARAVAPLTTLLELSAPFFSTKTRALFHKGRGYRDEIEESCRNWRFDLVEHISVTNPDGVVLEISNLAQKRGQ